MARIYEKKSKIVYISLKRASLAGKAVKQSVQAAIGLPLKEVLAKEREYCTSRSF
jgi:hypothetical protein